MIPVQPQPEPHNFDQDVRQPGRQYLANAVAPIEWQNREYWRRALPALCAAYGNYCAYLAMKIPKAVGNPTVDHFLPRKYYPHLAYEWSNFRLAAAQVNSRKRDEQRLIDPFSLAPGWFILKMPDMLTLPAQSLVASDLALVNRTIQVLQLNHETVRQLRKEWVLNFALGRFDFDFLAEEQPFIAQELQRQGLDKATNVRQLFIL